MRGGTAHTEKVRSVLFYQPGDRLSLPELNAARLDGIVVEVGEGFIPCDTIETADTRAIGIAELVPAHMAACGPSAAWIHGAGDEPPRIHHVRRTKSARMRVAVSPRVRYHERRAAPADVQFIAGVTVTTPVATALELLFAAALANVDDPWLSALLLASPGLINEVRAQLDSAPRRPGRRRARSIMMELVGA